jgi:hypothetical protein
MLYGHQLEDTVAYMEAVTGMGLMGGPMLGSLFYAIGGYILPFVVFTVCLISLIPVLVKHIPDYDTRQSEIFF